MVLLEATGVRKTFEGRPVLDGIDLNVGRDEIVALLGPNGAGKSVLLSCLSGDSSPDGGHVQVFDQYAPSERPVRLQTSVLPQGRTADPNLTGRENIAFYSDLHPQWTDRWQELVERFDIAAELDRPVAEYSGGMVRKLELTIALAPDVPLYLLDEPTAELDLSVMATVRDVLAGLRADGRTIILASHAPQDAELADRIAFVTQGSVVTEGSPESLREAVPPVVQSTGDTPIDTLIPEDRIFADGSQRRGFLDKMGTDAEQNVTTVDPTYTDMFNYYAHVID
ncbi:ABC transporter ATP-binding protein [Halobaculum sp. MBLA0147]|uniref:ABC transporter ATP-binding protein n=1 Tax=Halobaculum sp. MBLA0147 TaxID=3079934 RepID=UPI003526B0B1